MRLRSLVIRELQGVAPTTLEFGNGIHVLLGKNGTGKTTLLRLLVAIVRTDFRAMLDQNFDISYSIESPGLEIEVTARNQTATQRVNGSKTKLAKQSSEHELALRVTLPGTRETYLLQHTPEGAVLIGPNNQPNKKIRSVDMSQGASLHRRLEALYDEFHQDPSNFYEDLQVDYAELERALSGIADGYTEQYFRDSPGDALELIEWAEESVMSSVGRFDEALDVFAALTGGARDKSPAAVPNFAWRVMEYQGVLHRYSYPPLVPQYLAIKLFKKLEKEEVRDSVRLTANEFSPLKRFVELTVYTDASMVLRREERIRHPGTDYYELRFRAPEFHFDLPHGDGDISHEQLSFGEKRLLAFLYYQHANEIVIADELVNGLHHSWIEACLDALAGRQAFLVSQNPLLLDHLPFNSPDDVRLHLIRCQRGRDGETKMHWRNFSEAEAHAFHRGYETGVQHVSEILIAEGLW